MATDNRRWDTAACLAGGILNIPVTHQTRCPDHDALSEVTEDEMGDLPAKLEAGGVEAPMYYGCWRIWKHAGGFDGELMQYRALTDHFENATLDDAVERAKEWYATCYG